MTTQFDPNTSNSSKVNSTHTNNNTTNDSKTICLTTDDNESTFQRNQLDSRSFNNNPIKINVGQEQQQHQQQQQQQKLPINNSRNTRSHSNHRRLPSLSQPSIEPRKRVKKYQQASMPTCQVYFTPYTTNTNSHSSMNSTEKYVIPRPVLPRRHSMASYNNNNNTNSNNNFIRSDCFTHLPH
ncbi:unnamed protein product [Trichobilharzia regenti]|nr:unnamed protein product [Trichobilharzia regenti]